MIELPNFSEVPLSESESSTLAAYFTEHPTEARAILARIQSETAPKGDVVSEETATIDEAVKKRDPAEVIDSILASGSVEAPHYLTVVLNSAQRSAEKSELAKSMVAEFAAMSVDLPKTPEQLDPFAERVCAWSKSLHQFLKSPDFYNDSSEDDPDFVYWRDTFFQRVHLDYEAYARSYQRLRGVAYGESEVEYRESKTFVEGDMFGDVFAKMYTSWLRSQDVPLIFHAPVPGQPFELATMHTSPDMHSRMRVEEVESWMCLAVRDGKQRLVIPARVVTS